MIKKHNVRNYKDEDVTEKKRLINQRRQEVEQYYQKDKGKGTGRDSHSEQEE